ncbi:MAG TPA: 50S ribosomal protein L11 methyltransferase [Anaerolineae bacterium]|nr:50S ribosomal protein L11 methyltransferase [Anaerolineae bacterium]
MNWLEVSLTVNGELAEAIAELFARFVTNGVAIERTVIEKDGSEDHSFGMVTVSAYLPADEHLELMRQQLEEGLWHLSQIQQLPEPIYRLLQEEDWAQAWKSHYHPIPIGQRLMILPAWSQASTGDRLPVILNPGMAFGTGTHPTTRLCLIAIEDYLHSGQRMIDMGCGSGILSIAAARLGARHVQAWDNDSKSVKVARENVKRNRLTKCIDVKVGSLPELLANVGENDHKADLLVANILTSVLEGMISAGMVRAIKDGGTVILSGVLAPQIASLSAICDSHGLVHVETRGEEDWRTLVLKVRERGN